MSSSVDFDEVAEDAHQKTHHKMISAYHSRYSWTLASIQEADQHHRAFQKVPGSTWSTCFPLLPISSHFTHNLVPINVLHRINKRIPRPFLRLIHEKRKPLLLPRLLVKP
ncbi:hypothetical protein OSB04_un001108 [Centaurea solstitialis]|uniref:Uncharacterized protein n=1 Tax=Centaurea solstitialis TaxID=347529 RepID=A0AA38SGQ1_9ASTR|nr:hypothetical protein OSB04_un001108 [Centaurea solstitialis]